MKKAHISMLLLIIFIMTTIVSVFPAAANTVGSTPIPEEPGDGYLFEENFTYSDCSPIYDASRETPDPTGLYKKGLIGPDTYLTNMGISECSLTFNQSTRFGYIDILSDASSNPKDDLVVTAKLYNEGNTIMSISETWENSNSAHNFLFRLAGTQLLFNPSGTNTDAKKTVNVTTTGEHTFIAKINKDNTFSFWFDGSLLADKMPIQKNAQGLSSLRYLCFKSASLKIYDLKVFTSEASESDNTDSKIILPAYAPKVSSDGYLFSETFTYSDCSEMIAASFIGPSARYGEMSVTDGAFKYNHATKFGYFAIPTYVINKISEDIVVYAKISTEGNTFISLSETSDNSNPAHNLLLRLAGTQLLINPASTSDAAKDTVNITTSGEHTVIFKLNSNNTFSFWFDGTLLADGKPIQKELQSITDLTCFCFKGEGVTIDDFVIYSTKASDSGNTGTTPDPDPDPEPDPEPDPDPNPDEDIIENPDPIPVVSSDGYLFEETFTYSDCSPIYSDGYDPTGMYAKGLFTSYVNLPDMSITDNRMTITNPSSGAKWHSFTMPNKVMGRLNDHMVISCNIKQTDDFAITVFNSGSSWGAHNLYVSFLKSQSQIVFNGSSDPAKKIITKALPEEYNITILLNNDSAFSFWLNGEQLIQNNPIQKTFAPEDFSIINKINFRPLLGGGTVTIDDLRVYSKTPYIPEDITVDPELIPDMERILLEEDFDYSDCSPIYDINREVSDPTGMYAEGYFKEHANMNKMEIKDGELVITNNQPKDADSQYWYSFNFPDSVMNEIDDHMVISFGMRWTKDSIISLHAAPGSSWSNHNLTIRLSGSEIIFNTSVAKYTVTVPRVIIEDDYYDVKILITDDSKFSFWLNNEQLASGVSMQVPFTDIKTVNKINFKPNVAGAKISIDNIKLYTAKENSFFKADRLLRGINSIEDIAVYAPDKSIDAFAYSGTDDISISFSDSSGDILVKSDGSVNLPLTDTLTDITVTAKCGIYTGVKTFKDVKISAFYEFGDIIWPRAVFTGTVNEFTYTARARRSENQPPVNIIAVLYDGSSPDTEIKRLSKSTQSLDKDGISAKGFVFGLDLTDGTPIPENAIIKVFVWDNMTNMQELTQIKEKSYDEEGQRIDPVQE